MPILHRVQNGQSKFLTMMKPKTHKKVKKKKKISFPSFQIISLLRTRLRKKRRYPARHSRAQNSTLSQERERERKKETKTAHRARLVVVVQAREGVAFQRFYSFLKWCLNGLAFTIQTTMLFFFDDKDDSASFYRCCCSFRRRSSIRAR